MPHDHNHGQAHSSCADEHHEHHGHGHDHSHDDEHAPADNLFLRIAHSNIVALNSTCGQPAKVGSDETISIESDADDQMILRVPFTGIVKLKSVLIKAGPGDQTPTRVALYANEEGIDFDDVATKQPTQEFELVQNRDVGEYHVKATKFSNVSEISLFFPASQGAETIQLYYIGFMGTWTEVRVQRASVLRQIC
ncbi:DUF1000-domain-containing protein [Auriculariales sp. MPI-PUGE-AT-0066]|nr:DUF1000-domain-containing protein [Auriculariales sp. MPI-PUGE-AT-0066]